MALMVAALEDRVPAKTRQRAVMPGPPAASAAVLLLVFGWCLAALAEAQKSPEYELLVLRQDWPPSSCRVPNVTCTREPFGAFAVYELLPTNSDGQDPAELGGCSGPPFDVRDITQETRDGLACVFYSAEGRNEDLWESLWDTQGKCSGLSIKRFFETVIRSFQAFNVNYALATAAVSENTTGLSLERGPWLDRDALLDALRAAWGSEAWLACDATTRDLLYVSTCFLPIGPSDVWALNKTDCPWKRNSDSPGGAECAGPLRLMPGVAPSQECSSYYPITVRGAFPLPAPPPPDASDGGVAPLTAPSPPSPLISPPNPAPPPALAAPPPAESIDNSSGSSNAAVIASVVGGAVLAAAALAGLLVWRKRARSRVQHARTAGGGAHCGQPHKDELLSQVSVATLASGISSGSLSTPSRAPGVSPYARDSGSPASALLAGRRTSTWAAYGRDGRGLHTSTTTHHDLAVFVGCSGLATADTDTFLSHVTSVLTQLHTQQPGTPTTVRPGQASPGSAPSTPYSLLSADVAQWAVRWEQITMQQQIGEGSFGRVYLAYWNATPVAVKVLIQRDGIDSLAGLELPADVMRALQEEAGVMARMRHPNLVSFMGLCTLPPCILTEFCARGSLYDVLRTAGRQPGLAAELGWRRRLGMAFDAARGLLYLHCRGIIHRDVKSPNLLVDEHWRVKVGDFNLSEVLKAQHDVATGVGTAPDSATNPIWLAPEVLTGHAATAAADIYAFGLVLWELLAWRLPWGTRSPFQVRRFVLDGGRPEVPPVDALPGGAPPPDVLDAYCQLMRECWSQAPGQRPTFDDVVARLGSLLDSR